MNDINLGHIINEQIRAIVREEIRKTLQQQAEFMPGLPEVATAQEVAAALRVSEAVIYSMKKEGMPHIHAGSQLRFWKALLIEWQSTGRLYHCEQCKARKNTQSAPPIDPPTRPETAASKFSDFANGKSLLKPGI